MAKMPAAVLAKKRYSDGAGLMKKLGAEMMPQAVAKAETIYGNITAYPTLKGTAVALGRDQVTVWLNKLLTNTVLWSGIRLTPRDEETGINLDADRINQTAEAIQTAAPWLTTPEVLIFLQRFKEGRYERFYGTYNPQVVMQSLQQYLKERELEIQRIDRERRNAKVMRDAEEAKRNAITREEWEAIKAKQLNEQQNS
jgi:hypothetical protein